MRLTLKEAKEELVDSSGAYASTDIVRSINKAIRALAGMKGWQCLRRSVRFFSVGPCFTLPQGCAGLVRVCVNGRPTTVRGQDFRFLQSGPGDILSSFRVPDGFTTVSNVIELGRTAIMTEPPNEFKVFAYKDDPSKVAKLTIHGVDASGRRTSLVIADGDMLEWPVYDSSGTKTSGTEPGEATPCDVPFMEITSVVVDDTSTTNVTLYASDLAMPDDRFPISQYDYRVKVPTFVRYELPDVRVGQPVELLAEVRIDPLPLVEDSDVLPFDSVEPVEYMIRAEWAMRSGEASQADKYRTAAANWLLSQEITEDTKQTQFLINSVMAGSPGEISMDAENI